jgi:hypothetical protein
VPYPGAFQAVHISPHVFPLVMQNFCCPRLFPYQHNEEESAGHHVSTPWQPEQVLVTKILTKITFFHQHIALFSPMRHLLKFFKVVFFFRHFLIYTFLFEEQKASTNRIKN